MSHECCSNTHDHHENPSSNSTHSHSHDEISKTGFRLFLPALISFGIFALGLVFDHFLQPSWFHGYLRLGWYILAYVPVGFPVMKDAWRSILYKDFFSEFFLMTIATVGAFAIGEYPEGVAVMLFYSVGEIFQSLAVSRAKKNISNLLDQRPDEVTVISNGVQKKIKAEKVTKGETLLVKPGEQIALDGRLVSEEAIFNTAALTGESKPDRRLKGEEVLAGMINLNISCEMIVEKDFKDSKLSRILELVQNASAQKAKTELFIRSFARIYTPIVTFLAAAICLLPYFFVEHYIFRDWLYRALVFLVISCPCALVISIPLGYFGGIGAGSRNGILIKGSTFLDTLARVRHVVMDKTGTLTKGIFRVKEVVIEKGFEKEQILSFVNALESRSTHPVSTAIAQYVGTPSALEIENTEEIPGHGLRGRIEGKELLAGNQKLMQKFGIPDVILSETADTTVYIAFEGRFAGRITIADEMKEDAPQAIAQLHHLEVDTTILSGDHQNVVDELARKLAIDKAYGGLLPEDKVNMLKKIKTAGGSVAFVGDGLNDAPVIALSDVGMAMGGLGSDAAIESADVVIQDDHTIKIPMAIKIGRATRKIVWQNIILAFSVKIVVLLLGAGGIATMWEAVFADVGVALLAILNAVRIQNMKF